MLVCRTTPALALSGFGRHSRCSNRPRLHHGAEQRHHSGPAVSPRLACCCGDRHNCPHWLCSRALYCRVSLGHDPSPKPTWLTQFSCHRLMQLYWSNLMCVASLLLFSPVNFSRNQKNAKLNRSLSKCMLYKPYLKNIPLQSRSLTHFCLLSACHKRYPVGSIWSAVLALATNWNPFHENKKLRLNHNARKVKLKKKVRSDEKQPNVAVIFVFMVQGCEKVW